MLNLRTATELEATNCRAGRIARKVSHVVWCELASYGHVELDAEDSAHGRTLALAWMLNHGAMSASVRAVKKDGGTVCQHIYDYRDLPGHEEAA